MTDAFVDDESMANFVGYFAERLNRVFSYFYCLLELEADEDFAGSAFENPRAWALQTIQEACLHVTLLALRDLDDVLTPRSRQSKPDDFKVSDLGFPRTGGFLADSERIAINKRIAHSTHLGSEKVGFRWDVFELVTKGVRQSLTFLEWAASHRTDDRFQTWTSALYCWTRTKKIYEFFAEEIKRRKDITPTAPTSILSTE